MGEGSRRGRASWIRSTPKGGIRAGSKEEGNLSHFWRVYLKGGLSTSHIGRESCVGLTHCGIGGPLWTMDKQVEGTLSAL